MSPRTDVQFEEMREVKKAIIIDAALHLFAEEGFHATSIRQIAKKAKISKGLMYNYFESKEELLRVIFKKGVDELTMFFDRNQDGELTGEEMEYWIDKTMEIMLKHIQFWKLYFSMIVQPGVMAHVNEDFIKLFQPIMKIIHNYFENTGSKNPTTEARLFFALLDGVGMHYIIDPEHFPLDEVINRIKEIYIKK